MSSDYFFQKWRKLLVRLENLVSLDLDYQRTKVHEKKRCLLAQRLTGVLSEYIAIYNEAHECLNQNLQVQKAQYLTDTINSVVARILELKQQLRKLECSYYQFLSNGLANHKLTTYDAELAEIPSKVERTEKIQTILEEVMRKVKESKNFEIELVAEEKEDLYEEQARNWWDDNFEDNITDEGDNKFKTIYEDEEILSEETLKERKLINIIKSHEKTRQVTRWKTHRDQRNTMWCKELEGSLQPPAKYEIRERSAQMIQKIFRAYFELKRKKFKECQRDGLLGLKLCTAPNTTEQQKAEEHKKIRSDMKRQYQWDWERTRKQLKQDYLKRKGGDIAEDFRDQIRDWLQQWYNDALFFYDIPMAADGGSTKIVRDEVPSPTEWLKEYEAYIEEKKANKNKTALQLKWEKMEAKKVEMEKKKGEQMKKKFEEALMKKIMKNPNLHPGFDYPASKKTENIVKVIKQYRDKWDELDLHETIDVKKKYKKEIDLENICMEVKNEVRNIIDEEMREELKVLKVALKDDYKRNDEKMPQTMRNNNKHKKRKRKHKGIIITDIEEITKKIKDLATRDILKEYPTTNLNDIVGDHNFAGHDLRCLYEPAIPFSGEIRNVWWERCREAVHGFHRVLVVGPEGSGKTTLVHALATVNDAVLFELNLDNIPCDVSNEYLKEIVNSVSTCAKALQPSVIHIKHIHRLYPVRVPKDEASIDYKLIKNHYIRKLFMRIHKNDNITVVGSCIDPWLTKTRQMLKMFPTVVLVPNTNYSSVVNFLHDWMNTYRSIPSDLNIQSLAYVLQGYRRDFIKQALSEFMSSERIVRIAAYGLSPIEIFDHILEYESESKADYNKYLTWYYENTPWGKKEKISVEEQREFKELVEKWEQKNKKNTKIKSTSSSVQSLHKEIE